MAKVDWEVATLRSALRAAYRELHYGTQPCPSAGHYIAVSECPSDRCVAARRILAEVGLPEAYSVVTAKPEHTNPADLNSVVLPQRVTTDEAEHWLLNSCPTCLSDPCQCLPGAK